MGETCIIALNSEQEMKILFNFLKKKGFYWRGTDNIFNVDLKFNIGERVLYLHNNKHLMHGRLDLIFEFYKELPFYKNFFEFIINYKKHYNE